MDTIKDRYRESTVEDWQIRLAVLTQPCTKNISYVTLCKTKLHTPGLRDDEEIYAAKIELKLKTEMGYATSCSLFCKLKRVLTLFSSENKPFRVFSIQNRLIF